MHVWQLLNFSQTGIGRVLFSQSEPGKSLHAQPEQLLLPLYHKAAVCLCNPRYNSRTRHKKYKMSLTILWLNYSRHHFRLLWFTNCEPPWEDGGCIRGKNVEFLGKTVCDYKKHSDNKTEKSDRLSSGTAPLTKGEKWRTTAAREESPAGV